MALVLVIDSSHPPGRALGLLREDLRGHEVAVVTSVDAALTLIDQRTPDLVLFPFSLEPDEESALVTTLTRLSHADEVSTLAVPLAAAAVPGSQGNRWFFWFRSAVSRTVASGDPAAVFAGDLRRRVDVLTATSPAIDTPAPAPVFEPPPVGSGAFEMLPVAISPFGTSRFENSPAPSIEPLWQTPAVAIEAPLPIELPEPAEVGPSRVAVFWDGMLSRARAIGGKSAGSVRAVAGVIRGIPVRHIATYWLPRAAAVALLALGAVAGRTYLRAERPTTGRAELLSTPPGSEIVIDERPMGVTPLTLELTPGSHAVEFRYKKAVKRACVDIVAGNAASHSVDFTKKPTGSLRVSSAPPGAAVILDGRRQGVTPLTVDDVAVGLHTVVLQSESGTTQETVRVKADETAEWEASLFSGWLALFSPFDVKIREGSRALRLDDRHRIMLTAGKHAIELTNAELGYREVQTVLIEPGKTTAVSVATPRTALTINGAPGAEVVIDGVPAGTTPLANYLVDIGTREVLLKHPTLGQRRLTVTATVAPVQVDVNF